MRRLAIVVFATTIGLGATACAGSEAACAAVTAEIPATAQAGQTIEIEVANLFATCNDQGAGANSAPDEVTLELMSPDAPEKTVATGTADVTDDGRAVVSVAIPGDATGTLSVVYDDVSLGTVDIAD